jgi:APA family basic amino acid/polyamine antiporter
VRLERKMGLAGAVFFLVGNIVGASIFILPGELAGVAGPAVFLAYLLAAIPALANCLIAAQAGTLMPVSAADYVFTSVVLHPFLGFLKVWTAMISLAVSTPLLCYGFADYLAYFLPGVDRLLLALGLLAVLLLVNLVGLRTSVGAQMVMVVFFIASLLAFAVGGLFHADFGNLTPVMPNGGDAVLAAAVPAFFSYSGFLMLVIMAEEIREPERTIPWTLAITFVIVATIYTLVTLVLPALVPWEELGTLAAPIASASRLFLPEGFAAVLTVAALLAAATSANVLILTSSRAMFALGRNGLFPEALSRLNGRTNEPDLALLVSVGVAVAGVLAQGRIVEYASVVVIGSMCYGIVWAIALARLPHALPEHYARARFRLGPGALYAIAAVKVLVSAGFLWIAVRNTPHLALIYLALIAVGAAFYGWRQGVLRRRGVSIGALLRAESDAQLPAARAGAPGAA